MYFVSPDGLDCLLASRIEYIEAKEDHQGAPGTYRVVAGYYDSSGQLMTLANGFPSAADGLGFIHSTVEPLVNSAASPTGFFRLEDGGEDISIAVKNVPRIPIVFEDYQGGYWHFSIMVASTGGGMGPFYSESDAREALRGLIRPFGGIKLQDLKS